MTKQTNYHYPHSTRTKEELEALKSRYELIGLDQVKQAFASADQNYKVTKIEKPDSYSTSHVLYYVTLQGKKERLLFRGNIGYGQPEVMLLGEKLITDKLMAASVLTNKILYVDVSRKHVPFEFQIQKITPGEDLEDHFTGTLADYDILSVKLGEQVALMHQVEVPGFGRFDVALAKGELKGGMDSFSDYVLLDTAEELAFLVAGNFIPSAVAEGIVTYFNDRQDLMDIEQGVIVHYDVADHNILHQGTNITALIDWEAAVAGDPVLDIASMPTWKTHYPRLEKFLEGYQKIADLPSDFGERYALYRLRTLMWKTVFCAKAGILNDERLKRLTDCLSDLKLA